MFKTKNAESTERQKTSFPKENVGNADLCKIRFCSSFNECSLVQLIKQIGT